MGDVGSVTCRDWRGCGFWREFGGADLVEEETRRECGSLKELKKAD